MTYEWGGEILERSASGKVILCGEHAVVYGRPAIAVPVSDLRARARVRPAPPGSGLTLVAADLGEEKRLRESPPDNPLAAIARLTLAHLEAPEPDAVLTVLSDLPIAAGLGSGAAVSVAAARALAAYLGSELAPDEVSALAYEVEKLHHGTPSGIDNTVIAWERPVYFIKGEQPETFTIRAPLQLVIANSGLVGSTRQAVARVRRGWETERERYEALFNRIGAIAKAARQAIERGDIHTLAPLLNENHLLLVDLGISLPDLDILVAEAQRAGALGAKLTGGGMGGNIIALVEPTTVAPVTAALQAAGATEVWHTTVG